MLRKGHIYSTVINLNLNNWDTNYSFQMKAYKSGIKKAHNEVELCWGISQYGNRKYMLKYNIIL